MIIKLENIKDLQNYKNVFIIHYCLFKSSEYVFIYKDDNGYLKCLHTKNNRLAAFDGRSVDEFITKASFGDNWSVYITDSKGDIVSEFPHLFFT